MAKKDQLAVSWSLLYYLPNISLDDKGKTTSTGEYEFKVKYKNITKKGKLTIEDTKAPEVEVRDLTVGVNEEYDVSDFVFINSRYLIDVQPWNASLPISLIVLPRRASLNLAHP